MFWIVETIDQLKKLKNETSEHLLCHIITNHDDIHYILSEPIMFILFDIERNKLFILPIKHSESLNELELSDILDFLLSKNDICYFNIKKILKYIPDAKNCYTVYHYLKYSKTINDKQFNTKIHNNYYNLYNERVDINSIIPLTKHYEKWSTLFAEFQIGKIDFSGKTQGFYENYYIKNFYDIEKAGFSINTTLFNEVFNIKNINNFFKDDKIYTEYNFFHHTSRPSNHYNGLNINSLKKNSTERECFVSENDFLIDIDYNAYHPRIISNLIEYNIKNVDFYDDIINETSLDRSEVKKILFSLIYGNINDDRIKNLEFIQKATGFKKFLWDNYKEKNFIKSPISGRKIYNIEKEDNILPLLCQVLETEYNAISIYKILNLLENKKTKLILYGYDSFLLDYSKEDGKNLLFDIKKILEYNIDGYYPVNIKIGENYNNLQIVE